MVSVWLLAIFHSCSSICSCTSLLHAASIWLLILCLKYAHTIIIIIYLYIYMRFASFILFYLFQCHRYSYAVNAGNMSSNNKKIFKCRVIWIKWRETKKFTLIYKQYSKFNVSSNSGHGHGHGADISFMWNCSFFHRHFFPFGNDFLFKWCINHFMQSYMDKLVTTR